MSGTRKELTSSQMAKKRWAKIPKAERQAMAHKLVAARREKRKAEAR